MSTRGFTLVELLITLTILALLLAFGFPSFSAQAHNTRIQQAQLDLLEAAEFARTQAVFGSKRVVIKNNQHWEDGWEIFIDNNNNGIRDPDERVLQIHEPISDVRIIPNSPLKKYISFISTGESRFAGKSDTGGFQAGTIKICPNGRGAGFSLILARGGRMRSSNLSVDECLNAH